MCLTVEEYFKEIFLTCLNMLNNNLNKFENKKYLNIDNDMTSLIRIFIYQ